MASLSVSSAARRARPLPTDGLVPCSRLPSACSSWTRRSPKAPLETPYVLNDREKRRARMGRHKSENRDAPCWRMKATFRDLLLAGPTDTLFLVPCCKESNLCSKRSLCKTDGEPPFRNNGPPCRGASGTIMRGCHVPIPCRPVPSSQASSRAGNREPLLRRRVSPGAPEAT